MTLEAQLSALIDSAPQHIQRHFACDCAERSLRIACVTDTRSWKAIAAGRLYAEGRLYEWECQDILLDAFKVWSEYIDRAKADRTPQASMSNLAAAWAARSAARAVLIDSAMAAEMTMWASARAAERAECAVDAWEAELTWQIAHLLSLLETQTSVQISFLTILSKRKLELQNMMPRHAQILEEVLFT